MAHLSPERSASLPASPALLFTPHQRLCLTRERAYYTAFANVVVSPGVSVRGLQPSWLNLQLAALRRSHIENRRSAVWNQLGAPKRPVMSSRGPTAAAVGLQITPRKMHRGDSELYPPNKCPFVAHVRVLQTTTERCEAALFAYVLFTEEPCCQQLNCSHTGGWVPGTCSSRSAAPRGSLLLGYGGRAEARTPRCRAERRRWSPRSRGACQAWFASTQAGVVRA